MNKHLSQSIALAVSTMFFGTAAAVTIEKPPLIDRTSAINPSYLSAQEIINNRGFQREAGANDDSAGTRSGYLNSPSRPSISDTPNASITAINCEHAAYKTLCAEIDAKIKAAVSSGSGGSETERGWQTVYSGSGTRSIDPADGYSQYKVWFKYTASKDADLRSWETRTGSNQALVGAATTVTVSTTDRAGGKCGDEREEATTTAKANIVFTPASKVSVASSAYKETSASSSCVRANAEAQIKNFVITRFDAFY